jgi:uncharacterized protein
MPMMFDPLYFLILGPALLLALWAQLRVKSAYHKGSQIAARSGVTGAQAAMAVLRRAGVEGVGIEPAQGFLSDHYDPRAKVLRLSPDVYGGRSLAALGIAAHEAGHAIQDQSRYAPLVIRNAVVPLAGFGSNLAMILFMVGLVLSTAARSGGGSGLGPMLLWGGILLYSAVVFFQLVNLPVEFNASSRAKDMLNELGLVTADEAPTVRKVLSAAALTYVAATLTAILTLIYFIIRAQQSQR